MEPDVLKSVIYPKLILKIPAECLFLWVICVGLLGCSVLTLFIFDIPFGGIVSLGIYYYFWQKTEKNPYFLSEKKALRFHPFPKNIHKTEGKYYSA